ncbi:MAG: hypothetical protein R6X02_21710 [Enhygromyxa sp.]
MIPGFTTDEFASGAARTHVDLLAVDQVLAGERGTWIAVPPTNIIEGGSVPLVGCHVTRPGAPDSPVFERAAILVANELDTNELHVAPAFPPPEYIESPPAAGGQAMTGFGFSLDVCERLALPERPGRYALWMIVRERVTSMVKFRREHDPSVFRDSAVEEFLRRAQAERGPPAINPPPGPPVGRVLPRYGEAEVQELETPDCGVVLELPRVSFANEPVIVRGRFRLPARPYERCPFQPPPVDGPDDRGPSAIVGVRLVVTASDQIGPQVHELALPSFTRFHPSEARPLVSGGFALDLLALPGAWKTPRTYFIYVVASGRLTGPYTLSLVTREMVPGAA